MAPSTKRRTRRRDVDLHEQVDIDALDSSPTRRSVKKIKVEHPRHSQPERTPESPSVEEAYDSPHEHDTSANQDATDIVDSVISSLAVAKEPVAVMVQHSTRQENVKAYAKIAGRDWTYYVKTLHVNIGRPPDREQKFDAQSSPVAIAAQALPDVHIDLGPSKFVSRLHAEIYYDGEDPPCWRIRVNGRNGIRINNTFYKRGTASQISCGDIIEIANTQMMFVTPGDQAVIHPDFLNQAQGIPTAPTEDGAAWNGSQHAHPSLPAPAQIVQHVANGDRRRETARAAAVTPSIKRQTTPTPRPQSRDTVEANIPKPSPIYNRGLMMESTEEIDYSDDSAKDIKPPYSYANMIAQAIFSTEEEKLSLSNIYKFIMEKYAFYRHSQSGWQNSIRHNLSLNKAFQKVPRRTDEPGKGMKWQIVPEYREEYWKKQARKGQQSSAPSSPAAKEKANARSFESRQKSSFEKSTDGSFAATKPSPQTKSPGYHSFSVAPVEAYTPDRGSRVGIGLNGGGRRHDFEEPSPLPNGPRSSAQTRAYGLSDNVAGSPPVLSSSYYDDAASSMITPAPLRQQPRLAPPSTAQIPSKFMPMSSPAQFWKFADIGSTPAKPMPDMSPLKPNTGGDSRRWNGMNAIPSSSPPPPNLGSPCKPGPSRSRMRKENLDTSEATEGDGSTATKQEDQWDEDEEENEGAGFDLARGFQPISSYHRQISNVTRASASTS